MGMLQPEMRLSCHLIVGGQFYPAGSEVPPGVTVPGGAMAYVDVAAEKAPKPPSEVRVQEPLTEVGPNTSLFSS